MAGMEGMKNFEENLEQKKQENKPNDEIEKDFSKKDEKVKKIKEDEEISKKKEGDPNKNLDLALDYPTEQDVKLRTMNTFEKINNSNIGDKEKDALKNMLKDSMTILKSDDPDKLNKARQGLSFINDAIDNPSILSSALESDKNLIEKDNSKDQKRDSSESKETQSVFESSGEGLSMYQMTARKKSIIEAETNLLKANGISQGKIFDRKIIEEKISKTPDGYFKYNVKLSAKIKKLNND